MSRPFISADELRQLCQPKGFVRCVLYAETAEGRLNQVTWGDSPSDKEAAIQFGGRVTHALGIIGFQEVHEDFRLSPQHELKAEIDRLKAENERLRGGRS